MAAVAGGIGQTTPPEGGKGIGFGQVVGRELQQGLGTSGGPELLAAFQATIDLLDRRLDMAGGDRQAFAAIHVVAHPRLLVGQVLKGVGDRSARRVFRVVLGGQAEFFLARMQFDEHFFDAAAPDGLGPA